MSAANIYYVYQLVDPRSNTPFYIGEGKDDRAWSHLNFKSGCNNPHKDRVIRKIYALGLEVGVEILEKNLTKDQSRFIESKIIEKLGLDNLTNICANANPPILYREKNGFYGKTHSEKTKKILGDVNREKDIKTAEGKESIRKSMINRWKDPVQRQKQLESLSNRKGEKRSQSAIESYKKSAQKRVENMSAERLSEISKKAAETRKKKYQGMKRKMYIDENGNKRFKYVSV